jgi:hypothetical protein
LLLHLVRSLLMMWLQVFTTKLTSEGSTRGRMSTTPKGKVNRESYLTHSRQQRFGKRRQAKRGVAMPATHQQPEHQSDKRVQHFRCYNVDAIMCFHRFMILRMPRKCCHVDRRSLSSTRASASKHVQLSVGLHAQLLSPRPSSSQGPPCTT